MEILNTYAQTMAQLGSCPATETRCLLHVLTRDHCGQVAVYSAIVTRSRIATPAGRAAAAERVAFGGTKQPERVAGTLFHLEGLSYRA